MVLKCYNNIYMNKRIQILRDDDDDEIDDDDTISDWNLSKSKGKIRLPALLRANSHIM